MLSRLSFRLVLSFLSFACVTQAGSGHTLVQTLANGAESKSEDGKPNKSEMRSWVSRDGKFTVRARFLQFTPQGLRLETEDGRTIHVPTSKLSTDDQQYAREAYSNSYDRPTMGFAFGYLRDLRTLFKEHKITPAATQSGVVVLKVVQGGPAHTAGMKRMDVVTHIDDTLIADPNHLAGMIMEMEEGHPYAVRLRRPTVRGEKIVWSSESLMVTPIRRAQLRKFEEAEDRAKAKECPLKITGGALKRNIIGTPELSLELKNVLHSNVLAYEIEAECYNRFGDEVRSLGQGSHIYRGIGQTTISTRGTKVATWQLSVHDTTTKVVARVVRVKLENGMEWNAEKENTENVVIEMKE